MVALGLCIGATLLTLATIEATRNKDESSYESPAGPAGQSSVSPVDTEAADDDGNMLSEDTEAADEDAAARAQEADEMDMFERKAYFTTGVIPFRILQ